MLLSRPALRPRQPLLLSLLPLLLPLLLGKSYGALPEDLIWEIYPKQVALGETITISYQLHKTAKPFTLAVDVSRVRLEAMEFDETPVYGLTVHKMNATGRHEVTLTLNWGPGKRATLKGDVWVYIPLTPRHASLSLTNATLTPPGDVTMTLNLTSDGELPTLVTGTIMWGQGQASEEIDFSEQTAPGSLGNMSVSIQHSYSSAGFFPVEVVLNNPISSITLSSQVRVIEKLILKGINIQYRREEEKPDWDTSYYKTDSPLVFTAEVLRGTPTAFQMSVNGQPVLGDEASIPFTFHKAGEYNITMACLGKAGVSKPKTVTIQVAEPLTLKAADLFVPSLVVWPPGYTEVMVHISGSNELPTLVQGELAWGDGAPPTQLDLRSLTPPQVMGVVVQNASHYYSWHRTFQLTLRLHNPVSRINLTREVRVVESITLDYILVEYLWQNDIPPWPSTMFKAGVPLNLTGVLKSGTATTFNLLVDDKELTDSSPSIFYTFQSAGEYLANMTASGEAGVSPVLTASVVVVQPLGPHHLNLTLPDFVVVPPGNLTVQMVLTAEEPEELPSYVTYTVSWGDGSNTSLDDLMLETQLGASGPVVRSLTHTYDASGDFFLTWMAHNPVSETSVTKVVRVINHLAVGTILVDYLEESDRPPWPSSTFRSGVPLNFTAVVMSGEVTSYTFYVEGQEVTTASHYIDYTFQVAGEVMVNMTTAGEAGVSSPASITITLEHPVMPQHLNLSLNNLPIYPPGEASATLTVAHLEYLPTNLTGVFSWGDGEDTPLDLTSQTTPEATSPVVVKMEHNYTSAGEYTGHVSLLNSVSKANLSIMLFVLDHLTLESLEVQYEDGKKGEGGVFRAGASLTIRGDMETGNADQFTLSVNGEEFSNKSPNFTYIFPRAGVFRVTMSATGVAGDSSPSEAWLRILQPLREESAFLEVPEKVLSPPGETNITVTLSNAKELPTNVSGWVTWGDEDPPEEVGFLEITPPGAKGSVSHVLTHTYLEPGDYYVTWYIENKVSQLNLTKLVPVVRQLWLQGVVVVLDDGDQNEVRPDGFFFVGDTISLAPEQVHGQANRYTLTMSGMEDLVQDSPSFAVTFERESDYMYSLNAEGLGGISNTLEGWVRVRNKLKPPDLLIHPVTRVGVQLPITISSSSSLGSCLSLDLGDGLILGWRAGGQCEGHEQGREDWKAAPLSNILTLTHQYADSGTYDLVVRLFSAMGEVETTMNVKVFGALPCTSLNLWVQKNGTLESPVQITRAEKLWVRSFTDVNCSVSKLNMEITWKVVNLNDSTEEKLPNIDISKSVLYLPGRTLHYGLYHASVAYNISMINSKGLLVWVVLSGESVVEVGKSQLMVVIVKGGAPRIRRGTLNTITLNPGEISFDPDYPEIPLINYTWSCHVVGEALPALSVTSDPPESREVYEGKADKGGCWGEGPGWLTNTAPNVTIPVDVFRSPNKTYSLQVIVFSTDGRQNQATVEVEVVEGDPPTLMSSCNPPWFCRQIEGAQLVNPAKLILQSTCEVKPGEERVGEDGCGEIPLHYYWRVSGVPSSGGDPEPLEISGVAVGENMQKLALLDDFWTKFGTRFQMFDVQVSAHRAGESSQGLALQRIQINKAPRGGVCTAMIKGEEEEEEKSEERGQGIPTLAVTALVDAVFCNCTGWQDPEGLEIAKYSFFVVNDMGTKMILAFGSRSTGRVVLPFANLTLWAGVSDSMGAETLFHIANIEPLLPTKGAFDQYMARDELAKAQSVVDQTKVDMLLRAENSLRGITLPQYDYEELDAMKEEGEEMPNEEEREDQAAAKNKDMLGSVDKFSTTSMDEVIQVNNILGSIADPLPDEMQGPAVDVLVALSGRADKEAPLSQQKDFVAGALATTVGLMQGVNKKAKKSNATDANHPEQKATEALRRVRRMATINDTLYDEIEEEDNSYQPTLEDQEANEQVSKMLNVVGATQGALIQAAVVGEEPSRIDAGEDVNMAVGFFDAAELQGRSVEVGGAVYVFPSYCAVLGEPDDCLTNKTITIGVQMTKWKGAVHGYGGGREQLSDDSATVQLSLVDAESQPIPVNNSLEDFIMYIPRAEDTIAEPALVEPQVSSLMALSLHNVYVPAPRVAVTVLVRPENETEGEDWVLAWSSSTLNNSFDDAENLVFLNNLTYHSDTGFYELFLDSDTTGDVTGTYTVGVGRYNRTLAVPQEHPCFEDPPPDTYLLSYHSNFTSRYYYSTYVSSCLFFDNERLTWSSDGCSVKGANASVTICGCNHLTSFGSGFFVAPNTIDFSYVFANAGFVDNLTIYLTLIITLGLYFVGLVYARIMDKKDVEKVGATPLSDNNPNDHYLYVLIVHTGQLPNAGTKSKVQFLIVGDWDETDVRTLNDDKRPLLKRGAADHFVMATEKPLGPLQYLRIWHDNSGKGKAASWLFSYMVVRDVQTGEEFQFINNRWLAVEESDGQVDRLVAVAGEEQLKDYSHVFGKTVEKNFADDHLWFSIFLRPPRSRFTRVQRLSACMALLYLSMLANAMFYEKIPEEPGSGGLRLGPVSVSPQALGIGFISNLIVFPPSFCIVFFFRKSRPRRPKESRLKAALRTQSAVLPDQAGSEGRRLPPAEEGDPEEARGGAKITPARRPKKMSLPWWCVVVAWVLCVVSISVAVFFLWAYGVQFGNEKATKWLTALLSSIFSSILFTQPIKIYLMAMVLSWIFKRPLDEFEDYDDDEEEFDLESDEELLQAPPTTQVSSRRRSQIQIGAGLTEEELAKAKEKRLSELAMQDLLVEVLVYMIFLLIILSISHGDRDPNIYFMRENIKNTFALASQNDCPAFLKAQQEPHFWCWLQETMVPSLLDTTLYNGEHRPQDMCGTMIDRVTFLLGYPIIRQARIKPGDSLTHPATHPNSEETRDFGNYWNESGPVESIFRYRSALQIHGFPYDGTLDNYGGGGYLAELKGPKAKVMRTIASLQERSWVDKLTKALFVEFSVYNPQVNLFAVTMFVFEFIPGGGLITKFEFQALKLLRYHTGGGAFVLIAEIAYILFSLFYTRREFKAMKKQGWKYFTSVWNMMEVWVLALSFTAIVLYLMKTSLTYYLLDKFIESKGKKYIKIQPLAFLDEILGYVIAFQVFIGTLKLLKLLRFNRRIGMLSATLRYASGDIIGFGLIFTVTLISFVTVFYLSALTAMKDFSTFVKAAESSFFLINKKFDEITAVSPVLGPAFYFVFSFILYWIVFQLLIAIICHAFAKVSQDITQQPNDYEVIEYMITKFSAYIAILRPNAVQQVNIQPPKPPDIESQLRYLSTSLDKAMGVLDCKLQPEKKQEKKRKKRTVKRR